MQKNTVELTPEQVLSFRALRSHLAGPGGQNVVETARDILGAQAQQEGPAWHALSLRTQGRPTAAAIKDLTFAPGRQLVRVWGHRGTLHAVAASDWSTVISSYNDGEAGATFRRGAPPEKVVQDVIQKVRKAHQPLTRSHLIAWIPSSYIATIKTKPGAWSAKTPAHSAASRLIWILARRGELCIGPLRGREKSYVPRALWFPELTWEWLDAHAADVALCRRYLRTWAPANAADVAHYFGAKMGSARSWLAELAPELVSVKCGARKDLVALREDVEALRAPALEAEAWPTRFLPMWDTQMMTHKDKRWLLPNKDEEKAVWRKAAIVCATVLHRGRIVATWSHKATTKVVRVTVSPLGGWSKAVRPKELQREAQALAVHLGREKVELSVE